MPKVPTKKRDLNSARVRPLKKAAWGGPTEAGVTQSMLGNYLSCKERFYVPHILGLRVQEELSVPIEFGQMWHICEEHLGQNKPWEEPLKRYAQELIQKHRFQQETIKKLYNACRVEFPIYVEYWQNHEDVKARTPIVHEQTFDIPIQLPSKRVVRLRGKWDGVDLIGRRDIFLQENKSKTTVDPVALEKQLLYDLQTMTYLTAIRASLLRTGTLPGVRKGTLPKNAVVAGVRYNVVKRALSGGKGSIKQLKPTKSRPKGESDQDYYKRLEGKIREYQDEYFRRWKVDVTNADIDRFCHQSLFPILENLLDDYEWWSWSLANEADRYNAQLRSKEFPHHLPRHYRLPYGIYNAVAEGGYGKLDDYLNFGSTVGLIVSDKFFREL